MDGTLLFLGEFFSAEDQDHTSASGNCHKSRGEGSASRAGVFRFIRIIYRWIASIGFLLIWEEVRSPHLDFLLDPDQRAPVPAAQAAQLRAWSAHLFDLGSRESPE